MILIGVEAGNNTVRATAFDERGTIVAAAAQAVAVASPHPDWMETEQAGVFSAVARAIQELRPKLPANPELVCLTAPPDGLWLIDADGAAIRPAILPSDRRAASYVTEWTAHAVFSAVYRRAGYALAPQSPASLMRWLLDNESESLGRAATAFSAKDALLHWFTGARITDISDASAPFFDLRSRSYDEELIDLLRLRPIRHLLPPIDIPIGSLWSLGDAAAQATGLPAGLPVHAGPFDAIATGLAAGLQGTRDAFIILGPKLTTGVQIERLELAGDPTGRTVCLPRYDRWVRLLTSASGMDLLDWLLPLIGIVYADLDAALQRTPPGANGTMIVPAFSSGGETAPFVASAARGRIAGLTTETTRDDLARAACEALAFAARHSIASSELQPGATTLTGGGSRSPAFRQLLADVLDHPLSIAPQPETAARGAVIAGMIAAEIPYDHLAWTAPSIDVMPDPATAAFYADLFSERYLRETRFSLAG